MAKTNYYKMTFQKKDGSKGTKELTSTTKSTSQLASESKAWCKLHGYKFLSGSAGTRN